MPVSRNSFGPVLFALSAFAPHIAHAEGQEAHERLATAIASDAVAASVFEGQLERGFIAAFTADEEVRSSEVECPGLITGVVAATRPILLEEHTRDYITYRSRIAKLFSRELSLEHAEQAAEFYASDIGQKLLTMVGEEAQYDYSVQSLLESDDDEISAEAAAKDDYNTATRVTMALEPLERAQINRVFSKEEWAIAFVALRPQINAIQSEIFEGDYSPEADKAIDKAMDDFFDTHFEACYKED